MPIGEEIAVTVVAHFIADHIKMQLGGRVAPIDQAIADTARAHPDIEGLETTLRNWLRQPSVVAHLQRLASGFAGPAQMPLGDLVSAMVGEETGFAMLADTEQTARAIVRTFLDSLRAAYWGLPEFGLPAIGNRLDCIVDAIGTLPALHSALKHQYDHAESAYTRAEFPVAKTLFESLLLTLETFPGDTRELRVKVRTNLARIGLQLDDKQDAILHIGEALRLDPSSPKTRTNWAVALLLQQKPSDALKYLELIEADACRILEYWSARAEALLHLGRTNEAIATIERSSPDDHPADREFTIGLFHMHAGQYGIAASHFARALDTQPDRPEFLAAHAEALLIPITNKINQSDSPRSTPSDDATLSAVIAEFDKARSGFEKSGRPKKAVKVQIAIGATLMAQGKFDLALQRLYPLSLAPDPDPELWRNLGTAYLSSGKPSEAVAPLERAVELGERLNEPQLLFAAYMVSGNANHARSFAEARSAGGITRHSLPWHLRKAEALRAMRKWTEAQKVLDDVRTVFADDPQVLLQIAEHYEATGETEKAEENYRRALECAPAGRLQARIRLTYGNFLGKERQFSKAAEVWEPIVRPDHPEELLVRYCIALYNSGQLAEILPIAANIRGQEVPEKLADIFASAHEGLNNLDEAILWLKYLGDIYGNKTDYLVRLAIDAFRRGRREEAVELLDGTRHRVNAPSELMAFAQAYASVERCEQALELALQALNAAPEDPDITAAYVTLFGSVTRSGLPDPQEKYIIAYQNTLREFSSRFPDSTHIRSIIVKPDDIAPILQMLDQTAKRGDLAIQLYREQRFPLCVFSQMLGRDVYETWLRVISDDQLQLLTAFGTSDEAMAAEAVLSASPTLVVDLVSLFTNALLGTLSILAEQATIYVEQSILDELHRLQAQRQGSDEGYMLAGKIGDQYTRYEVSADEARRIRVALDQATEFVERHAIVTGLSAQLTADDEKCAQLLGEPGIRTLLLAREKSLPVLTDDKAFGELGRQIYATTAVNTQAVLVHLVRAGSLDRLRYDRAVVKLVHAGYTHVMVDAQQIFQTMAEHAFQITPQLSSVLRSIESPKTSVESAARVTADTLKLLFIERLPAFTREAMTLYMLDLLTRYHNPGQALTELRQALAQTMGRLLVLQLREIELYIRWWERQPVVLTTIS
jgi:tetratricopeptide (TPR) repeat protein